MIKNEVLLKQFYTAFASANSNLMSECYHPKVQFSDPVFGLLKGKNVVTMWEMLLEKSNRNLIIEFTEVIADEYIGSVKWTATYRFSKTNRKVVNSIHSKFQFQDNLIIKQTDDFDVWKWASQALGISGYLLGWTGYLQKKIQQKAADSLKSYSQNLA
jgi:hypothetical protein